MFKGQHNLSTLHVQQDVCREMWSSCATHCRPKQPQLVRAKPLPSPPHLDASSAALHTSGSAGLGRTRMHLLRRLACRLIALDKNLGVRPIGIGDTARNKTRHPRSVNTQQDDYSPSRCSMNRLQNIRRALAGHHPH